MKIEEIRELILLMKDNKIGEIDIQSEGNRIRLKALGANPPTTHVVQGGYAALPAPMGHHVELAGQHLSQGASSAEASAAPEEDPGEVITSPIVGIFYASPSPDKPAFVQAGDTVDETTVVCIIEAMKVMNEIKAEMRGTVRKILVETGQPVEFGQPLFIVEPAG